MYQLQLKNGSARRGSFQTVHGTVQTPAFMNVGTAAAIKGGISSYDLKEIKCQVEPVSYTHLDVYKRQFMGWPHWEAICSSSGPAGNAHPSRCPTRSTSCPAFKSKVWATHSA